MMYAPLLHATRAVAWLAPAILLAGCLTSETKPTARTDVLPFEQAVAVATDGLMQQTQKLPAFLAKVESKLTKKSLVVDPMFDSGSGQQTTATVLLEQRVVERIGAKHDAFETLPFQAAGLSKAQYLLAGTMRRQLGREAFRIDLSLTELKTGQVVAQASAVTSADGVDDSPTAYYRDSPVLVKDQAIDGYVRTAQAQPGTKADAYYIERLPAAALISEGTVLYNAGRYQDALGRYDTAAATQAGQQMRSLNGQYLANWKLGRPAEAEQAFAKVVALGIAYRELGVKFLFNPGSTEFWSDTKVSGPYGMWLRQIARESAAAKACMDVVGHTSRTGSEQVNDLLSRQRADAIRQRLSAEVPELAARIKSSGMGFRQNIIGSGTDNVVDALDRRVEFKIQPCG